MNKVFKGIKDYSQSQLGIVEAQFILTSFITIGLFLGAFQIGHTIGFVMFAFGCFQLLTVKPLYYLWRGLKKQFNELRRLKKNLGVEKDEYI
jgi:hypothetical protein